MKFLSSLFISTAFCTSAISQPQTFPVSCTKIQVRNEYDTLKEAIVGIAPALYFPDSHSIEKEDKSSILIRGLSKFIYPILKGKRVPRCITKKFQREENRLIKILEQYHVKVYRPDEVIPLPTEPLGLGQMYARDPVLCVGNTFVNAHIQIPMREKEERGFTNIIEKLKENNLEVKEIPKDTSSTYLEGGDVLIDFPYIYVGIGKYASNMKGAEWLQGVVGEGVKVIPVQIKDESILHLDCIMTLIGPKSGIIHSSSLVQPLPSPLNEYNFIEVDSKTRIHLGTNILMLNPKTIIVQKKHKHLIKQLELKGYTVIPIKFTWHTILGGAFRCATCPLTRS